MFAFRPFSSALCPAADLPGGVAEGPYLDPKATSSIRALLASRKALVRECIDPENEVRGLLEVFGIKLGAGTRAPPCRTPGRGIGMRRTQDRQG